MITATLQEAKATLNRLVEKASSGEQVVLMRGARVVATILPLSADDIEIVPRLTDSQAEKFWREISEEKAISFKSPKSVVGFLKRTVKGRK